MTSITWAGPRYVQELGTFLGPENRTQRHCDLDRAGEVEADQGEQQGGGGVEAGGEAGVEARHAQPAD